MQALIQFCTWAVVFIPAEYLFSVYPIVAGSHERGQNILLMLFNTYVTASLIAAFTFLLYFLCRDLVPAGLGPAMASQPFLLQVVEAAVIMDLGVYASHALSHSRLFWRFHEIHHSAEEMTWLVAFRFHPVDLTLYSLFSSVPAVLMGFSIEALAVAKGLLAWHAILSHSTVRLDIGPLRHVFVGPKFHHWHHANERDAYNRNFGGLFVVWDRLFGTLHKPTRERAEAFGTTGSRDRGIVDLLAGPFRRRRHVNPAKSGGEALFQPADR